MKISLILLAGGKGLRMGRPLPKQFLPLAGRPIALHSLEVFLQIQEIAEIIVVCAPQYRHFFPGNFVRFAEPGHLRQESVYNGLQVTHPSTDWVCTHDAARPFITLEMVSELIHEGKKVNTASLAMPVKNTLKEIGNHQHVTRTLDRSTIWEIQTPQLLKKSIIHSGFEYVRKHALTVTDDVSLAEYIGEPVKLIPGSYNNIKITTPEDLSFAEWIIQKNTSCALPMTEPTIAVGKSSLTVSPSKA